MSLILNNQTIVIGVLIAVIFYLFFKLLKKNDILNKQNNRINEIEPTLIQLKAKNDDLISTITLKDELFKGAIDLDDNVLSKITSLFSDLVLIQYDLSAKYLEEKSHPAFVEAERIRELKKVTKKILKKKKLFEYKYEYLINVFPELEEYVDSLKDIKELESSINVDNLKNDFDYTINFISKEEYNKLSVTKRNQLALERYIKGNKSNWQIGRDFELFCGQYYENKGWKVSYFGMENYVKDLGRDLIAYKDNEIHVIQCKYWSAQKGKIIHEKHILQLYATTKIMDLEDQSEGLFRRIISPTFITNVKLSDTAIMFAKMLDVKILNLKMEEFPRIKCNISKNTKGKTQKIYHLPFDQQYNKTQIKNSGEFYAWTVKEAEKEGFRRAKKFFSNSHNN